MEASTPIDSKSAPAARDILLFLLIVSGFAARIVLLCFSTGHGDVVLWEQFGSQAVKLGLNEAYRVEPWLNHPPLALLYGATAYRLSVALGLPFPAVFKGPFIVADALTCLLLYRIYRSRAGSSRAGLLVAVVFAWNIDAMLMSAFHGNTDSVYAMLCVACVWLADSKQMPLLAGLALGLAINIKLLPGMFIIPLLLLSRSWREFFRFTLGLAIMSLPFAWMLFDLGYRFKQRVIYYRPVGGSALSDLLISLESHPLLRRYAHNVLDRYVSIGKPLILMCGALPALAMRRRDDWNRYRVFAMAAVIFVLVSPAFAVQYTVIVGAALLAYDLRAGAIWGALSGMQLLAFYLFLWDGRLPLSAQSPQGAVGPSKYLEMILWTWALAWLIQEVRKMRRIDPLPAI